MDKRIVDAVAAISLITLSVVATVIYENNSYIRERSDYNSLPDQTLSVQYISKGGVYGYIAIKGDGSKHGLLINANDDVVINKVVISNVVVPIIFSGKGSVTINTVYVDGYSGDGLNIRQSNVSIKELILVNPKQPKDDYHQDLILQAYAVKENGYTVDPVGVIENNNIPSVTLINGIANKDLITLSEDNIYRNFKIGNESFVATFDNDYYLNASNLSDSAIGNTSMLLLRPNNKEAVAFIRDRKGYKGFDRSHDNKIVGKVIR